VLTNGNGHKELSTSATAFKGSLSDVQIGTTIKPSAIYDLADKNGGGVLFRLPNQGDGWITQDLEGNIEKNQKIAAKELGVVRGDEVMKFKWTEAAGINQAEVKTG
jgi:hypothetical protein